MIIQDYKSQSQEYLGTRPVIAVYKGSQLVWTSVRSCFGKGYWINDKPWVDTDAWKNN